MGDASSSSSVIKGVLEWVRRRKEGGLVGQEEGGCDWSRVGRGGATIVTQYYTRITCHHSPASLTPSGPFDSRHRCHYQGAVCGAAAREPSSTLAFLLMITMQIVSKIIDVGT